jgi:hypothetical protein
MGSSTTNSQPVDTRPLAERLEATSHAVAAAHDAHLRQAVDSVRWERRGLLGRLVRIEP